LQPSVPRDLETICLKCLEKEPSRRYASAETLADDLRRFLDGEPIHARSYNVLQRLTRTLDRKHLKIEFRTWGNVFLLFAPIIFLLIEHQPPYLGTWVLLTVVAEETLMGVLFWYFRSRTLLPLSTIEGQLVSMWTAYLVAAILMMVVGYQMTEPGQAFDILPLF